MSIHPSIRLSVCPLIHLSIPPSVHPISLLIAVEVAGVLHLISGNPYKRASDIHPSTRNSLFFLHEMFVRCRKALMLLLQTLLSALRSSLFQSMSSSDVKKIVTLHSRCLICFNACDKKEKIALLSALCDVTRGINVPCQPFAPPP